MANASTTHVIEIETGIGEPAFIPLSMGHELQPISVGKKGMWRIESPRVLDVHAFVYFDGTSLFLQSADESNAASVDGFRVGKAWTELHAPCKIEIGLARLRFRSLLAADNQPTEMAPTPPVQAPPGGPGSRPGASMPVAGAPAPPRMTTGQRSSMGAAQPPPPSSKPGTFPKPERPFKPGEFSSSPDEGESTRIAPIEAGGAGRMASGAHARLPAGSSTDPGPYAPPMMMVQGPMADNPMPPMGYGPPQGYDPSQPPQQGYDPNQPPQQGYDPNQPPYGQPPYPNAAGSGAFRAMPPGGPGMPQPGSVATGGYGSMTPQGVQQPPAPAGNPQLEKIIAKLKENSIPKIVAGVLFIIGGILYLAEDDDPAPPKRKPVATLDGGSTAANGGSAAPLVAPPVMAPVPVAPTWPAGVPCPPPNWPPNTPLPCTPNGVGQPTDSPPARDGGKQPPALPAGTKTLERQAVDLVVAGETAKAAAAYEELVRREPANKVYAEAARILRAKLDAGAP